ncbi:Protein of unknown function [Gryllus bimaculatus]|nr:Protein of unknown function [Gryllus bimaculatus]
MWDGVGLWTRRIVDVQVEELSSSTGLLCLRFYPTCLPAQSKGLSVAKATCPEAVWCKGYYKEIIGPTDYCVQYQINLLIAGEKALK